ncbi:MAG: SHD1 domain-containing protein [Planctomycetota bacterium]|nr:SHD1 domain-containing protein [Planctomycetota bacterium]
MIVEEEATEVQVQRPISPEPAPALEEKASAVPPPPAPAEPALPAPPKPAPAEKAAAPAEKAPAPAEKAPAPAEKAPAPGSQADTAGDAPVFRTWTDVTGSYQTQAQLVAVSGDVIRLLKSNGRTCRVSLERLSVADRQYLDAIRSIASVN